MSKIGKMPIIIPREVTITIINGVVNVKGAKGELNFTLPSGIQVERNEDKINVAPKENAVDVAALWGLTRAQIANMVKGVSTGFEKKLELAGVGYRAAVNGRDLVLSVGFSHPVKITASDGITFTVLENTITVAGFDKILVGDIAAKIRAIRPPEPYKGKGISYKGEKIRRKAGKAMKAVAGK